MIFFPFRRKVFTSALDYREICSKLEGTTRAPMKELDVVAMVDKNDLFEMRAQSGSFLIGKGAGSLNFGRFSVYPIMKGSLKKRGDFTHIIITIKPYSILLPLVQLCLMCPAIYLGIRRTDFSLLAIPAITLLMTYYLMIEKFEKNYKQYVNLIEEVVNGDGR